MIRKSIIGLLMIAVVVLTASSISFSYAAIKSNKTSTPMTKKTAPTSSTSSGKSKSGTMRSSAKGASDMLHYKNVLTGIDILYPSTWKSKEFSLKDQPKLHEIQFMPVEKSNVGVALLFAAQDDSWKKASEQQRTTSLELLAQQGIFDLSNTYPATPFHTEDFGGSQMVVGVFPSMIGKPENVLVAGQKVAVLTESYGEKEKKIRVKRTSFSTSKGIFVLLLAASDTSFDKGVVVFDSMLKAVTTK